MSDVEQQLRQLKNAGEVRRFLHSLCEPWGGIRKLELIPDARGNLVCFVSLRIAENRTRFYPLIRGTPHAADTFVFTIPAQPAGA